MDGFLLSPGITPTLTDIFVVELPLAAGIGWLADRRRGWMLALAFNALALGGIKLATDYADRLDLFVAFGGLLAGLVMLASSERPAWLTQRRRTPATVVGIVLVVIGGLKIRLDFFDPFDILLADTIVLGGLVAVAVARGHIARGVGA